MLKRITVLVGQSVSSLLKPINLAKVLGAIVIILLYTCILLKIHIDELSRRNKILVDRIVYDSTVMGDYEARMDLLIFKEPHYYMPSPFEDKGRVSEKLYDGLPVKYQYYVGELDKPLIEALCKGYNAQMKSLNQNNASLWKRISGNQILEMPESKSLTNQQGESK